MKNRRTAMRFLHGVALVTGLCTSFAFSGGLAHAGEGKISGLLFGDAYWFAEHHNNVDVEGQNGFWLRRIYLTYDYAFDEAFTGRVRFEMASPGSFPLKGGKMEPFVKDAYLRWKLDRHNLFFGLTSTPTWDVVEKSWGYRPVEKSPLDLHKGFGSSRDTGVAIKGYFDEGNKWGYHLLAGNGSGTSAETNKNKKIYLALTATPSKRWLFQVYGDFENNSGKAPSTAATGTDAYTLQAFAFFGGERGRLGLLAAQQTRELGPGMAELELEIYSLFGVWNFSEKFAGYARVDQMSEPNPEGDKISYLPMNPNAKSTFGLIGLDFEVGNGIHILPNVEAVSYSEVGGVTPDDDLIPRVTLFYTF